MKKLKTGRRAKRSFTPEFRADAVRLVVSGKSATQVAKDLDLTETALRTTDVPHQSSALDALSVYFDRDAPDGRAAGPLLDRLRDNIRVYTIDP